MSDDKPDPVPPFPMDDDRSVAFHVAMGTLDAAASFVPGASYGVQQLVRQFIGEPLERRREAWFTSLGLGVRELQDRFDGFDPASLSQNEEFIDAVAETTRVAMATHRAEKLEALRNIVLNTAAGVILDEVLRGTFLGYVDRFSTLHLRSLKVLAAPTNEPALVEYAQKVAIGGSLGAALCAAIPETRGDDTLLTRAVSDLEREELVQGAGLRGMMSQSGIMAKRSTPFGDQFLRFISSPVA